MAQRGNDALALAFFLSLLIILIRSFPFGDGLKVLRRQRFHRDFLRVSFSLHPLHLSRRFYLGYALPDETCSQ